MPNTFFMFTFREKIFFLTALILGLLTGNSTAQEDSVHFEVGTIHAVKPRISPYFSAHYTYTVIESAIKDPGTLKALFVKDSRDTLNKKKLVLANPEKGSLSQDMSERVKYQFSRADTPYLDSMKISFRINKQGKLLSVDLDALGPLRDSMQMKGWKPVKPHDIILLELYKLFGVYQAKDLEISNANPNPNIPAIQPYSFRPGGYKTKAQVRNAATASDNASLPLYRQNFNCIATIIVSTSPQTPEQKTSGIRFVTNDKKTEPGLIPRIQTGLEVPVVR
jgi:hypothetical protein